MTFVQKLRKNEKGLTLIELLAVLVIVGIIAAIAVPAIGGIMDKSKTKADIATVAMVKDAAEKYVVDKLALVDSTSASSSVDVKVSDLIDEGYLSKAVTVNNIKEPTMVKIIKTGKVWTYKVYGGDTFNIEMEDANGKLLDKNNKPLEQ